MKQNFPDVDFIQLKIETKYARDYGKKKESKPRENQFRFDDSIHIVYILWIEK